MSSRRPPRSALPRVKSSLERAPAHEHSERLEIVLELGHDADAIQRTLTSTSGAPKSFSGWLTFTAALEKL